MGKCYQLVSTHMPLSWTWGVWVHGSTVRKHTANAYVLMTLSNNIQLPLETKPDKQIRHDILCEVCVGHGFNCLQTSMGFAYGLKALATMHKLKD